MKRFVAALAVSILAAASVQAGTKPIEKPDVLGEEQILTSERLSKYDTLLIRDFDISNPEYENIDADERKDVDPVVETIPKVMSAAFVSELQEKKKFKKVQANGKASGSAAILEGKVTKLSGGHGAAKFFLGWMAPQSTRTRIEVSGRLVDANTGKELATFSDVKSGLTGAQIGWLKEVFINLSGDLGRDLAEFVEKLH